MFKPGESGNPDGRPKGSQNAYTKKTKEAFGMLLENNLDNLSIWLEAVAAEDPKEALKIIMSLSERFVPKLSQQALTNENGGDLFAKVKFQFGPPIDSDQREQEETDDQTEV